MHDLMKPYSDDVIEKMNSILPKKPEDWQLVGIVNKDKDIYTFGNDSKIIGRAFEVVSAKYIHELADQIKYTFHESKSQTVYPDFFLENPTTKKRIAIDIKSTYREYNKKGKLLPFSFTLGSFTSYLRDGKKNIDGEYNDYDAHYVLAFLYSRTNRFNTELKSINEIDQIPPAYDNVEVIFMEKFRIGGFMPGSGNTDNLATFSATSTMPFNYGYGPFAILGRDVFDHYWRNHPKNKDTKEVKSSLFRSIPQYFTWLEQQENPPFVVSELRDRYEEYKNWVEDSQLGIRLT